LLIARQHHGRKSFIWFISLKFEKSEDKCYAGVEDIKSNTHAAKPKERKKNGKKAVHA